MDQDRQRGDGVDRSEEQVAPSAAAWIPIPAILAAVVLSLPCLGVGYLWDDFVFLTRAQSGPIGALAAEHGDFYRPLSRVLYFWPLAALGSPGAMVAHLVNLALLALSIYLLVSLTRDLAGPRAGILAGLAFALLGVAPSLVAWASASQDLLAITWTLAAFHLRNSGRNVAAGIAAAAGLLSKETVLCVLPVLVLWDWIVGRRPARIGALGFGGLALAWILIHPGIRGLLLRGFGSNPGGYVGLANPALFWFHARRYFRALFNIPDTVTAIDWSAERIAIGAAALVLAVAGLWLVSRLDAPARAPGRLSLSRATALAVLVACPAIVLPALLIRQWAGYLVCLPAIGSSLLIGVLLSRLPVGLATLAISAFLVLGLCCRGAGAFGEDALTEHRFVEASRAIREVESGFRKLHPTFPHGSQVLISVAASGRLGIDATMHDGQAIRVWYRDPTIRTLRPERRLPRPGAEYLFMITPSREVVEIDPDRGRHRSSSGGNPDGEQIRAVSRTAARGLAASGERDRAVRILERLAAGDEGPLRSYDLRLAAMAFLASGDREGAARILSKAPPISRELAMHGVARVMAEPTMLARMDSCAYVAFGLSSTDSGVLRYLMELFYASRFVPQAVHFARRLQDVAPGDSESAEILRTLTRKGP